MKTISILTILLFATTTAFAKPEKVLLDVTKSVINWKGAKEFTNDFHKGTVALKSGYVEIENGAVTGGEVVIDMNKVENTDLTDSGMKAKLVGHLQSADFFDTQKFQTATYKLKKVTKNSDNVLFEGELTVKNKTNPMRINTAVVKTGKVYAAKGTADFDRSKYDVKYNSQSFFPDLIKTGKDKVIKNTIELEFDLKTVETNQ
ncbi:MAG: YceI family protein [Bdellovibrionaceae bacterium]|nr:YceI family protein [Pseudobdellovibrionaceae bacterium]